MHRFAVGAAFAVAALAGCLKEKVPFCDNGALCPEPLVCTERAEAPYCGRVGEVEPCRDKPDEASCDLDGTIKGYCSQNICKPCDTSNAACVYSGWTKMESPTTRDLFAIWVVGPRELYAVGSAGMFVHWRDPDGKGGPESWRVLTAPGPGDLKTLGAASTTEVYTSSGSTVYRYDGSAWIPDPFAGAPQLQSLWVAGPSDIFTGAGGGVIGRYTGAWNYTTEMPIAVRLALWGNSSQDVFAAGNNGTIIHWNGTMWMQQPTSTTFKFVAVHGNGTTTYAVGNTDTPQATPIVFRYSGVWTNATASLPTEVSSAVLSFRGVWANGASVFVVGDAGKIVQSTDSGGSWTAIESSTSSVLNAVGGSGSEVYAVGNGGTVLRYHVP